MGSSDWTWPRKKISELEDISVKFPKLKFKEKENNLKEKNQNYKTVAKDITYE